METIISSLDSGAGTGGGSSGGGSSGGGSSGGGSSGGGSSTPAGIPDTGHFSSGRNLAQIYNSKGTDVAELQHYLNVLGYNAGSEDGDFGPNTDRAVRQFQKDHNLSQDGIVGSDTTVKLKEAYFGIPQLTVTPGNSLTPTIFTWTKGTGRGTSYYLRVHTGPNMTGTDYTDWTPSADKVNYALPPGQYWAHVEALTTDSFVQWSHPEGNTLQFTVKEAYEVSYHPNTNDDVGNFPDMQAKIAGQTLTLSSSKPTRTGYTFQGWATSPTGSVAYTAGASYTNNAKVTLYAVWTPNTSTVSYNANTSDTVSGMPSSQAKAYGVALALSGNKPTRTGYTFQGWATSSTGSVAYAAGASYTNNANVTLYAVWKPNTYPVSYNANTTETVSGMPANQTKTHGVALTLRSGSPTRTGYTFQGWATSSTGGVAYAAGANYTNNASVTLYAVWKVNTYTVSYNANTTKTVSGMPASQTKIHGAALTLSGNIPTRTGYTFQGWATASTDSVSYAAGASYTNNMNVTLYAVWKPDTYTVSYDANTTDTVSEMPSGQIKTHDTALPLLSNKPVRTGYTFLGWAESANGLVIYEAGANYTSNSAVTLYAVWKEQSSDDPYHFAYRWLYPGYSGVDVQDLQTYLTELGYTVSDDEEGIFGAGTQAAIIDFQADSGLTVDGVVGPDTVVKLKEAYLGKPQLTVNADTTSDMVEFTWTGASSRVAGAHVRIFKDTDLTGTDYTEWDTSSGMQKYLPAGKYYARVELCKTDSFVQLSNTVEFTVRQVYDVSYTANTDDVVNGIPDGQAKIEDRALMLSGAEPTRTGYTFRGWAISETGSVAYAAGAAYTDNAAVTLYAVWEINTYTVSYNANTMETVSGMPASQSKTHGVALTLSGNNPTRTGYTFQGWATSAAGTVVYAAEASYTNDASMTLFAVWEPDTYTVSYNANTTETVSGMPANQTKTHDVALTLSGDSPTRTGYIFRGWAASESGSVAYAAGAGYTGNTDVTLYAVWEKSVSGVILNKTSLSMDVGTAFTLVPTVIPNDAANKAVIWSSSDPNVATVNNAGFMIAKDFGTATITVTTVDGGYTATCEITISDESVTGITLSQNSRTIVLGEIFRLSAMLQPSTVQNRIVYWTSSDPDVVSVTSKGTVFGMEAGTAVITGQTADGGFTDTCTVTVVIYTSAVKVSPTAKTMNVGDVFQLRATVQPSDATNKSVIWSSSDPNVARVDDQGNVTATGKGTATITATTADWGLSASCSITVTLEPEEIEISQTVLTLIPGRSANLTATVLPEDADDTSVVWTSSDPGIATVDDEGSVRGVSVGSAMITAASAANPQIVATCAVTVKPALILPAGLVEIGEEAFAGIAASVVVVPQGCEEIGARAFANCANLTDIHIPSSVLTISRTAFTGCSAELTIHAPTGSVAQMFATSRGYAFEPEN